MDASWWIKNGAGVKGRLTRAEKAVATDPVGALATAFEVDELMQSHGYPDWWSRVQRLELNARMAQQRQGEGF
jgi:hypothetical protein